MSVDSDEASINAVIQQWQEHLQGAGSGSSRSLVYLAGVVVPSLAGVMVRLARRIAALERSAG